MAKTSTDTSILVVGAAGHFAGLVVPALASRGAHVRGLIRRPEEAGTVLRNGAVETAVADLSDPTGIQKALQGMDGVFYIGPQFRTDEAELGLHFVEACKKAGVRRFVFSSILHPTITSVQVHAAKIPVEAAVVESGLEFTILQLAMFYQNMTAAWPSVMKNSIFAEPFSSTAKLARVDYRDVAEVAAIALTENTLVNGTFELCADSYLSREDVVKAMSDVVDQPITAATVSFDEWAEQTKMAPEDRQPASAMYAYYGNYGSPGNPFALRAILGREPRSLRQFFDDLAAGIPTVAS